jgi:hypothetical protein
MALEGPKLDSPLPRSLSLPPLSRPVAQAVARVVDDVSAEELLDKALQLALQVEEVLEDTRSVRADAGDADPHAASRAHSTRMARAMAASLVDELQVLARPSRNRGCASS